MDVEGLAQLTRTGWFTPVHFRIEGSYHLRALVSARAQLIDLRKDLEGHIRGVLKTFGIRLRGIGKGRQRQGFRVQLAAAGERDPILRVIADGFIAAHATLCQAAAELVVCPNSRGLVRNSVNEGLNLAQKPNSCFIVAGQS